MDRRSTTPTAALRHRGPGRSAGRLPHQPRGRAALRRRRGPRPRRLVDAPAARRCSSWWRPVPGTLARSVLARHADVLVGSARYVLVGSPPPSVPCTLSTSRSSRRSTFASRPEPDDDRTGPVPPLPPDRSWSASPSCRGCPALAWCWPTSCSTTSRSASPSVPPTGGSRSSSAWRDHRSSRCWCPSTSRRR